MSKENFKKALEFLFHAEGGYNNDAADPGGPTNMGVTQTAYNAYRQRKNLPYKDVRNITKQEASKFAKNWEDKSCEYINGRLFSELFGRKSNGYSFQGIRDAVTNGEIDNTPKPKPHQQFVAEQEKQLR